MNKENESRKSCKYVDPVHGTKMNINKVRSWVMKTAWSIKKEHTSNSFSKCLKMAWGKAREQYGNNPRIKKYETVRGPQQRLELEKKEMHNYFMVINGRVANALFFGNNRELKETLSKDNSFATKKEAENYLRSA